MSRLHSSDPPVQIGSGTARVQTTPFKHSSPVGNRGSERKTQGHTLESIAQYPDGSASGRPVKVGSGDDPLAPSIGHVSVSGTRGGVRPPPGPLPPTPAPSGRLAPPQAITPIQASITPPPKPLKVEVDPVIGMTETFLAAVRVRPVDLKAANVQNDMDTLRQLTRASAWKAAVDLSELILHSNSLSSAEDCILHLKNFSGYFGREHTDIGPLHEAAKLRFEGLFRLKLFEDLSQEATAVLHIEEKRQKAKAGTLFTNNIVAMRLLLAEVKACTRKGDAAITDLAILYENLEQLEQSRESGEVEVAVWWRWRACWALINTMMRAGMTTEAVKALLKCHEDLEQLKRKQVSQQDILAKLRLEEAQILVLCRLSRTLLQNGALKAAIGYCDIIVERLSAVAIAYESADGAAPILARMTAQMNFARALALFGINNFEEAMTLFEAIIEAEGDTDTENNFHIDSVHTMSGGDDDSGSNGFPSLLEGLVHAEQSLVASSMSNYAVCALYLKRVQVSVDGLEKLIQRNPARYLTDPVVFNLCTLYDLSCSPELSARKKRVVQRVALRYHVQEPLLNVQSFRLS